MYLIQTDLWSPKPPAELSTAAPGRHVTPHKVNARVTLNNTITSLANFSYFHPKYVSAKTPADYMTTKLKRNEPCEEIRDSVTTKDVFCGNEANLFI